MLGLMLAATITANVAVDSLDVRLLGNAGVRLSDGETTVLIDLPYVSGAFGYQTWDPADLQPTENTVAAFTHAHDDHFDPSGLNERWVVMGGEAVIERVRGVNVVTDSDVTAGAFVIRVLSTPHSRGHRSYRVDWRGRSLYFTGDTESPGVLIGQDGLDVVFTSPWLSCLTEQAGHAIPGEDIRAYHLATDGSDRICGGAAPMEQGSSFVLLPTG